MTSIPSAAAFDQVLDDDERLGQRRRRPNTYAIQLELVVDAYDSTTALRQVLRGLDPAIGFVRELVVDDATPGPLSR